MVDFERQVGVAVEEDNPGQREHLLRAKRFYDDRVLTTGMYDSQDWRESYATLQAFSVY